jgi:hypothetical protein
MDKELISRLLEQLANCKRNGAFLVGINPRSTALTRIHDLFIPSPSSQFFHQIETALNL